MIMSGREFQRSGIQLAAHLYEDSRRASEYLGATTVTPPGMYVPPIVIPAGGVCRYPPVGTGG